MKIKLYNNKPTIKLIKTYKLIVSLNKMYFKIKYHSKQINFISNNMKIMIVMKMIKNKYKQLVKIFPFIIIQTINKWIKN